MALRNTYFESNKVYEPLPIPEQPGYIPPVPPTPPDPDPGSTPVIPRPAFTGNVECDLYINSSENNKMFKDISLKKSYDLILKKDTDLINPVIELNDSSDLTDVNYMYLNGKYYFVDSIECMRGNIWKIHGHVDVLMTYRYDVIYIPCIIEREQIHNDLYVDGGSYVKGVKNYNQVVNFSSGFNDSPENILICCGG